jgi:hypothetical protein
MRLVCAFSATLLFAVPTGLPAQNTSPDSATIRAAIATLKSDLRNFVVAQEAFFADSVTYARSLRHLGTGFKSSAGVTIIVLTASDESHSEIAIIDRVPSLVCAMFVGDAPRPFGIGEEGKPICRGP